MSLTTESKWKRIGRKKCAVRCRMLWPAALLVFWCDERTKEKKLLNATVLDYLLEHPELIPEDCKFNDEAQYSTCIFLGTIFKNQGVGDYVCYLYWAGDHWDRSWKSLLNTWDTGEVALIERKNLCLILTCKFMQKIEESQPWRTLDYWTDKLNKILP